MAYACEVMVLPIIMMWFGQNRVGPFPSGSLHSGTGCCLHILVSGQRVGTDPFGATSENITLPIILNNQLNLNASQTIAFLTITATFFPDHCGPFLDSPSWLLFTMNINLASDVWRNEHDTINLMAHYVTSIHIPWHSIQVSFVLVVQNETQKRREHEQGDHFY
jgi:hypothetical protein